MSKRLYPVGTTPLTGGKVRCGRQSSPDQPSRQSTYPHRNTFRLKLLYYYKLEHSHPSSLTQTDKRKVKTSPEN